MLSKLQRFIHDDIWRIRLRKLPPRKYYLIRALRVFLLSLREFSDHQCQLWASSLTFYSLLSIVPVLALAFGVAQGFGLSQKLEDWLLFQLQGQEAVLTKIILFSHSALENAKGSVIAGVGVVVLFWAVIRMLGNIEQSFDYIWGVKKERSLLRKFSDYLFLAFVFPIAIITASSINVFLTGQLTFYSKLVFFHQIFDPLIFIVLAALPYCVFWGFLSFIYLYMPNTKVNWKSAFMGGIIAGTLYQLIQWFYIRFQIQVSQLGAIYGSFAALPFFLIWLQLSWLVILYGAEIAFAHQNEEHFEFELDNAQASAAFKKLIALEIVRLCIQRFSNGEKPWTAIEIAHYLDSPIRLIRDVIHDLFRAKILAETKSQDEKEPAFQPALASHWLTLVFILQALERSGVESLPLNETEEIKTLRERLRKLEEIMERSPENIPLEKIAPGKSSGNTSLEKIA